MKQRETLIRKIIPVELFDMAGLEHWLSDMAAQGLHLVKLNHDTARFRRGEPVPGVRFGLEITGVSDIDRERNAAYQEAGWTYVTTLRNLYYVYRTERVDAPPLHTDPALQSQQWNKLYRSARRSFVRDVFLLVLAAVLTALLLEDTPILHLLTTSAVPLILYGLYQLCSLPAAWAEVQDLSRLVRRLEAGEPMDHRAPLSFLSAPLAEELLSKSMKLDEDIWWTDQEGGTWQVSKHADPRVKFLSTARKERTLFQTAAAATGGQVVLVRYTGHGDLSEYLEDIIQMAEGGTS